MLLLNRNFRLLWFGQLVSQIGDKAYNIVLMWWLFEQTKSPILISIFLVASMLPELIVGPIAGVYIDCWNKKKILVLSDFFRGVVVLSIAALYQSGLLEIWHVYVATVCISLCSALFNPTTMAIIPVLVDKDKLQQANALSQMVAGAVSIIGPLLGASSMAIIGYVGVLMFNGFSYIISGVAEAFLRIDKMEIHKQESMFSSLMEGFRYIQTDKRVAVIVAVIAVVHVFVGSILVVMPFLANILAGKGVNNLGILEAAIGVGIMVGAIYISKYANKRFNELYLFYAIMCMGLGVLALGALQLIQVHLLSVYAIVCVMIGFCVAVASVFWQTIAQLSVPPEMSGRVFSVFSTTGDISLPLAIGGFGILLNYMDSGLLLALAGVCLSLIGIVLVYNTQTIFKNTADSRCTGEA